MTSAFYYRVALAISLIVNVLLVTWIYYFDTVEGVLSIVETAVGIVN